MTQLDRRTLFKLFTAGAGTMPLGERMAFSQTATPDKTLREHLPDLSLK